MRPDLECPFFRLVGDDPHRGYCGCMRREADCYSNIHYCDVPDRLGAKNTLIEQLRAVCKEALDLWYYCTDYFPDNEIIPAMMAQLRAAIAAAKGE